MVKPTRDLVNSFTPYLFQISEILLQEGLENSKSIFWKTLISLKFLLFWHSLFHSTSKEGKKEFLK